MNFRFDNQRIRLRHPLKEWNEFEINSVGGGGMEMPGRYEIRGVIIKGNILAQFGELAVNTQPILIHPRAVRPTRTQVHPEGAPIRETGGKAGPIPEAVKRLDPTPKVEAGEGLSSLKLNVLVPPLDGALSRQCVLFAGELKLLIRPGDDHIQGFMSLWLVYA